MHAQAELGAAAVTLWYNYLHTDSPRPGWSQQRSGVCKVTQHGLGIVELKITL